MWQPNFIWKTIVYKHIGLARLPQQKTYKSSGQKHKYILILTLTWVSLKSMRFHTSTYLSFLSVCDQDGRQRSIPLGPFWQIEWSEYNLLFLEGIPCDNRVRPLPQFVSGLCYGWMTCWFAWAALWCLRITLRMNDLLVCMGGSLTALSSCRGALHGNCWIFIWPWRCHRPWPNDL